MISVRDSASVESISGGRCDDHRAARRGPPTSASGATYIRAACRPASRRGNRCGRAGSRPDEVAPPEYSPRRTRPAARRPTRACPPPRRPPGPTAGTRSPPSGTSKGRAPWRRFRRPGRPGRAACGRAAGPDGGKKHLHGAAQHHHRDHDRDGRGGHHAGAQAGACAPAARFSPPQHEARPRTVWIRGGSPSLRRR